MEYTVVLHRYIKNPYTKVVDPKIWLSREVKLPYVPMKGMVLSLDGEEFKVSVVYGSDDGVFNCHSAVDKRFWDAVHFCGAHLGAWDAAYQEQIERGIRAMVDYYDDLGYDVDCY